MELRSVHLIHMFSEMSERASYRHFVFIQVSTVAICLALIKPVL
jgi:hypothetical protein